MQETWRQRIYVIVDGSDTRLGRAFDIALLIAIISSVAVVMLDSVMSLQLKYNNLFNALEWIFTILFTIEYLLRIFSAPNRLKYIISFYGIIDLLSLLPAYLSMLFLGVHYVFYGIQYLIIVRVLRILRIFRILRLTNYLQQAGFLVQALHASRYKIAVFFIFVMLVVTIFGSVIYVVEGAENGFTSIPMSIYWAIVTMTTVGYGDISPKTPLGQAIASLIMITGYSILAVPTGLFTAELTKTIQNDIVPITCSQCGKFGHENVANFCNHCGEKLNK